MLQFEAFPPQSLHRFSPSRLALVKPPWRLIRLGARLNRDRRQNVMLSTLNLKRAKSNDPIESADASAIAIAPGAEESCPAPDTRPSRDPSSRTEPRFNAASAAEFTASDFTAERMVPQAPIQRPIP